MISQELTESIYRGGWSLTIGPSISDSEGGFAFECDRDMKDKEGSFHS